MAYSQLERVRSILCVFFATAKKMLFFMTRLWNEVMRLLSTICLSMVVGIKGNRAPNICPHLVDYNVKGLAQSIRDTFAYGDIDFEDERVTLEEFQAERASEAPFGQLPILHTDDGVVLAQSKSILRWASKHVRTYPKDATNAALIDEWCDLHTEFMHIIHMNMYPERYGLFDSFDKAEHRKWIIETHLPKYLSILDAELSEADWLAGMDQLSMADLCWYPTLVWLKEGTSDGVDAAKEFCDPSELQSLFEAYPSVQRFMQDMCDQLGYPCPVAEEPHATDDKKKDS